MARRTILLQCVCRLALTLGLVSKDSFRLWATTLLNHVAHCSKYQSFLVSWAQAEHSFLRSVDATLRPPQNDPPLVLDRVEDIPENGLFSCWDLVLVMPLDSLSLQGENILDCRSLWFWHVSPSMRHTEHYVQSHSDPGGRPK